MRTTCFALRTGVFAHRLHEEGRVSSSGPPRPMRQCDTFSAVANLTPTTDRPDNSDDVLEGLLAKFPDLLAGDQRAGANAR